MLKRNILFIAFVFIPSVLTVALPGHCQTADAAFAQLKLELEKEGASSEFINATESSVRKMIKFSAPAAGIKTVLMDLWNEGVKGRALKNAVTAVAELVASGDNVLEAAKIASAAAHKAEAEGLSGFSVGMRVKKAVQDRKAYLKVSEKQ